ncbi:41358_t:CDS:2 [Gigaspora margarita]|uniref:41358_t:CDS:1 n=1 Tax=Gigaspora margarita TaxID=4874 RepID=A0ABN7UUM5_GIGMA|nr:41358_t:CDS:2 [Gigaspora margarita]
MNEKKSSENSSSIDRQFKPHELFDVIIIGSGIAGSTFAIRISQLLDSYGSTFEKILMIEEKSKNHGTFKVGESLPSETKPVLQSLGIFEMVNNDTNLEKHLYCYGNRSAWGSNDINGTDSIFNPYGHGFHLDRSLFEETLLKTIELRYGQIVKIIRGFSVTDLYFNFNDNCQNLFYILRVTKSYLIVCETQNKIYGKILVDASGRRCYIRKCVPSLKRYSFDKLLAFACLFETACLNELKDNDHYTLVESCRYGWFQTSQLPNNQRIVIFFTDDDLVKQLPQRIRIVDKFCDFLRENTSYVDKILKKFDYSPLKNRVMCMAANSDMLSEFASIQNHWIAIGDSAISFDPLSSQGMLTTLFGSKFGAESVFFQFFYDNRMKNSINLNIHSEKSEKSIDKQDNAEIQPIEIYQNKMKS